MLQYLVSGLVVGCIYAIASTSLVMTYRASGILNFGFGGIAYGVARVYFWLNTQHAWPTWAAGVMCILVISPAFGVLLYFSLIRFLGRTSTVIKVITTIGVGVTLPPLCLIIFGDPGFVLAPGLAAAPVPSYFIFGVAVTLNQVIVVASLAAIVVIGYSVLRFTQAGLLVRATVDSPALTSINGRSPAAVNVCVWAAMTAMAGLAGVLLAPIVSLEPNDYAILVAGAFTAVLVAKLVNLGRVIIISLLLGVISNVIQYLLPPNSSVTSGIIAATPFAFILLFLLWEARRGYVAEPTATAGQLDKAITPSGAEAGADGTMAAFRLHYRYASPMKVLTSSRVIGAGVVLAIVALLPLVLPLFWTGQIAEGVFFAVIFLSFTLVIGEGGMIWLCQVSFAGIGAALAPYFAAEWKIPILLAVLIGGLVLAPAGLIVGWLTARLGAMYIALATLALGVLIDSVVLSLPVFTGAADTGVTVNVPTFLTSERVMVWFGLGVFVVVAAGIEHYRRSSAGLAIAAVRSSEAAARSIGISIARMKAPIAAAAAVVAGIGGGLLVITEGQSLPSNFETIGGLVWLAVVVTLGVRSNTAALLAGLTFTVMPAVFQTYLPLSLANVPPALFGLGAIMLARNPDGAVSQNIRQFHTLMRRLGRGRPPGGAPDLGLDSSEVVGGAETPAALALAAKRD